ncbi:MAG: hypothetical protein B7Y47_02975 [Sphingomonas sp. 28-63-12]|nr:MAG: hypothetical protein B7Y47_02975 [Sphingomonas sp. 28-63-12]
MHHAVNDRSAWANDNAWALWCDREKRNPLERFFYLAPGIVSMTNDPLRVLEGHAPVATFVDLLQLGNELRAAILPRVADASITNWQYDDHGDSVVVTIDDDEGELVE